MRQFTGLEIEFRGSGAPTVRKRQYPNLVPCEGTRCLATTEAFRAIELQDIDMHTNQGMVFPNSEDN